MTNLGTRPTLKSRDIAEILEQMAYSLLPVVSGLCLTSPLGGRHGAHKAKAIEISLSYSIGFRFLAAWRNWTFIAWGGIHAAF